MAPSTGISLKPSEMAHGGGLVDDVDVTIKESKFVAWDYQGKQDPVLALGITFTDDDGTEYDAYFSAGNLKDFVPSKDGKQILPVGTKTALNDGSNFAFFLTSAINAGFPEDQIENDITILTNMYCHVKRVPQPKRSGIADTNTSGREKTILTVEKIHALPWDNKGKKVAGKPASGAPKVGGKPAVAAASGKANGAAAETTTTGEIAEAAQMAVMEAVSDAGGSIAKAKLSQALFKQLAKDPNRNTIVALAFKDDFLLADGQPWQYDGTNVSMG